MKCVLVIAAAGVLSACVSLDGPVGPASERITIEYDSKKANMQEARKQAANQCEGKGKRASLVTDNPKPFNIRRRAAVFECR
ncbi:MAG: hypothetical protein OEU46_12545 [Alphaproteobacteria bacterium]|nr:hypothetical protein [Alphaproteobacteria bacterium]